MGTRRPLSAAGSGRTLVLLCALFLFPGCWYYSFTGATIPSHLRSIAIPIAQDLSVGAQTDLSDPLTEQLVSRFVRQTRLNLENDETVADVVLNARVDRYTNQPTSVGGQEQATLNRVTVTVTVTYFDRVEDRELLNRAFTSFGEYDPVADGMDGEITATMTALDNIASDVFTAATSNW